MDLNWIRRRLTNHQKKFSTLLESWAKGLLFQFYRIEKFQIFRSYGSVHKAIHRESGHVLAIKKVPVDTDLQEIIKEISIMQQCKSKYVVKYYGSYFKHSDLWVRLFR